VRETKEIHKIKMKYYWLKVATTKIAWKIIVQSKQVISKLDVGGTI